MTDAATTAVLGAGIDTERGWGRAKETWSVREELEAYGADPTWFGLGDRDVATHLNADERIAAYTVEAENFESIHNHSAYALIERDKDAA